MTELGGSVPSSVEIEAVVIRADGTQIPLGVISSTKRRWRFGPGRARAWLRIKRANRSV